MNLHETPDRKGWQCDDEKYERDASEWGRDDLGDRLAFADCVSAGKGGPEGEEADDDEDGSASEIPETRPLLDGQLPYDPLTKSEG